MKMCTIQITSRFDSLILASFFFIFLLNGNLRAQSYEGIMSGETAGKYVRLFIWVDLEIPKANATVKGSYFYKNIGKEISLCGEKKGNEIILTEKDKNQNSTGIFSLNTFKDGLKGFWCKPDGKDTLQVDLYRTNPSFKNTAKIPKLKELLAEDIEFYSSGLSDNDSEQGVNYSVLFTGSDFLSIGLNWENYNYTAHYGTVHYMYHLPTMEAMNLKDEITDKCQSYLCRKLQEIVETHRLEYTDAEWIESLYPYIESPEEYKEADEKIQELFTVTSLPQRAELYLDSDGLVCFIEDYCEQYFSAGNRAMTFDCVVTIPFHSLEPFIKKESVLQNLFYK